MILDLYDAAVNPAIWAVILATLVVSSLLKVAWTAFRPGFAYVPGPRFAAFTHWWRLADVSRGKHHETLVHLHRKHGKLVRIGPNAISVADPEAVKVIYGLKSGFSKV